MKILRWTALAVLALSFTVAAKQSTLEDDGSGQAVARIGTTTLTRGDLEHKEAGKLLQARYTFYQAERKALDELIDNELLQMKAAEEHLTVDQLLDREVNKYVKDPTEEQIQIYYEGMDSNEPYADVRQKVIDHVRDIRRNHLRSAYLQKLRQAQGVTIALFPPSADLNLENAEVRGPKDAPVQVVEFADYECPYCQKVYPELDKLQREFPGKVSLIYKDFPLPMHSRAQKAAEATRCAGEQGKYWELHDLLFQSRKLDVDQLKQHARTLKLDGAKFDQCLDSGAEAAAVKKDQDEGKHLGLSGTPSFFVNGHFMSGALNYDALKQATQEQLAAPELALRKTAQK